VVPCFCQNAGGLNQNTQRPQRRVDSDCELRLDAKALRAIAVPFLDAALGVTPIAAHVPFADGAGGTRLRIGAAHNPDNEVATSQTATRGRDLHFGQRFMAEYQTLLSRRRGAVTFQYLSIRPADAERQRARQDGPVRPRRLGNLLDPGGTGNARRYRKRAHFLTPSRVPTLLTSPTPSRKIRRRSPAKVPGIRNQILLNAGERDAHVAITIYFSDREPVGPFRVTVAARRTLHLRFNDLDEPQPIPRDTDYASLLESDVPIVAQHTRLDSRRAEVALLSTVAYAES